MQTDDGQIKEAFTISAGLDYPGIGPMHADLAQSGRTKVVAINDDEAIYAGYELTRTEGIIPAIESAHAVAALKKLSFKSDDIVVLTVSGRGDKDILTYLNYNSLTPSPSPKERGVITNDNKKYNNDDKREIL